MTLFRRVTIFFQSGSISSGIDRNFRYLSGARLFLVRKFPTALIRPEAEIFARARRNLFRASNRKQ